ncbi:Fur family transcriptional regulator [Alkalimarinus coralli]|uniref:Fur family transcriptional regulator n=1 Tax=Alkalimarinus coralli TaxID=2935863 RepID=UPI00202B20A4|nr:Fur family transcriptional regulator [Alkalimarinus coralli]
MGNVDAIINHAEQYCKKHGSRLTTKRKQVLASLVQSEKALSAYDLIDLFNQEFGEKIPAMSVYRILEFLEDENLVHKLNLAKKYVACSHITCDHDHGVPQFLICSGCNHVKEISINTYTIAELQKNVENAGFQLVSPQLEMNCICNECAAKAA